jgi:hypothetical protein
MVALAMTLTGGAAASPRAMLILWGSAAAAVTAALVVLTGGPASLGWMALGYVLAAALAQDPPYLVLILLAVAYMPLLGRPRGSLALGLALAAVSAVILRIVLLRLL